MRNVYNTPINFYYSLKDKDCIRVRSAFAYGFSNIERKLKKKCNFNLGEDLTINDYETIKQYFHNMNLFTFEECSTYLDLIYRFRSMNAHFSQVYGAYYTNKYKFVYEKINKEIEPPYKFFIKQKFTFYGMIIAMALMLDKAFINDFFEKLLEVNDFNRYLELSRDNNTPLVNHTKTCYILTFNNSTIKEDHISDSNYKVDDVVYNFLNRSIWKTLSNVIYNFEYVLISNSGDDSTNNNFKTLLYNEPLFKKYKNVIFDLVTLRNVWLHGCWLYDEFQYKKKKIVLSIQFILKILYKWKVILIQLKDDKFKCIVDSIEDLARSIIGFKYSRLIELSSKLLDLSLFDECKVKDRIRNLNQSYSSITSNISDISNLDIDTALEVLGKNKFLVINRNKFLDFKCRNIPIGKIRLYHITSDDDIYINGINTDRKEIGIYIPSETVGGLSLINNKNIKECNISNKIVLNNLVEINEINI